MEVSEAPVDISARLKSATFFEGLYEASFPSVARFVSKMNGSFEDAKDIYHDALVIYHEKSMDPQFSISVSPEAYILGIAKHLWIRRFKKDRKRVDLDATESALAVPVDYDASLNTNKLLRFLERSGKRCMDLLRAFYYEKLSVKDIVPAMGFRNEHSATAQKYKCLEKLRNTVKEKAISYDDFIE